MIKSISMKKTIAALDPLTGARCLLVEVHTKTEKDEKAKKNIQDFKARMFRHNIRVGILITHDKTVVVRDMLSDMKFENNNYKEDSIETKDLLKYANVGVEGDLPDEDAFTRQVIKMLEAIGSSWYSSLLPSAVSIMVPDVVGNLAQAELEVQNGLLDDHESCEG
jgi:hypothetical protein